MTVQEKTRWKTWADSLRQEMMTSLTTEVTKSVAAITSETETTKPEKTVQSERFWRACQEGSSPHESLAKAGFEVDFEPNKERCVQQVTLRLNATWRNILQGVIDRQNA